MEMKRKQVRLKDHTDKWIEELAKKENMKYGTMIRELLERLELEDSIRKQLNEKKKRGK